MPNAPGVNVYVDDQSSFTINSNTTTPLIVLATRANKTTPTGAAIASGTTESKILRTMTSQRALLQTYGTPSFVTSKGVPIHGDETNEYGLLAAWSFLETASACYVIRADIDLGQLEPSLKEPTNPVTDNTYWLDSSAFKGGLYRRNAANTGWTAVSSSLLETAPTDSDGTDGDIVFDYSTTNGTIKVRTDATTDKWKAFGTFDLTSQAVAGQTSANNTFWASATAPTGAGAYDYWWNLTEYTNGLKRFRASDGLWIDPAEITSTVEPTSKVSTVVWEDISSVATDGTKPFKVGNGTDFSTSLTYTVSANAPTLPSVDEDLWYSSDFTDFAMYQENDNVWTEIVTVTDSDPTATEKVISSSAPSTPASGAIWVDTSDLEKFPWVKRWNGVNWEDISSSITYDYQAATTAINGTYWINLDDPKTKFTVKEYDSTYEPVTVVSGQAVKDTYVTGDGRWKPFVGARFGRKAQRFAVVRALQEAIVSTEGIDSESIRFSLAAVPGYSELYDEGLSLTTKLKEHIHFITDVPFSMKPSGTTAGREITVAEWSSNANGATETGEDGFTSSGNWTASAFYPHCLTTNSDGNTVMAPASHVALRALIYADSIGGIGLPAMGYQRGVVQNASSVGYLDSTNNFKVLNLGEGDANQLYNNNINPIQSFYQVGLRIMGNRTLYGTTSKLQQLHIARLVSKIKYDLSISLRRYLGLPHNAETWALAQNTTERYLAGLTSLGRLEDYVVVVNEENNTAARRNAQELYVEVGIIPTSSIDFVLVPLTIAASGDTL